VAVYRYLKAAYGELRLPMFIVIKEEPQHLAEKEPSALVPFAYHA
jgi:hypothetical protein